MPDIDKPHKTGHNWLDIIIGVAVIAISIASLWVAAGESRTQQKLLAASVWPDVQYGSGNATPDGKYEINLSVTNAGTGPAKIKWFTMYYKDKAYATIHDLMMACCGVRKDQKIWALTSGQQDNVLAAHDHVNFVHMPGDKNDMAILKKLDRARRAIYVRACFCSVLDDCWLLDARQDEPTPVNRCPDPEKPLFEG